jgi:hypothetical protein
MACWHWNRQLTQPPVAARCRLVAMKIAKASVAATAVPSVAAMIATSVAAWPNWRLTGPANTSQATATIAAKHPAGRA